MNNSIELSHSLITNNIVSRTLFTSELDDLSIGDVSHINVSGEENEEFRLGLEFVSTEDAYRHYKNYAGKMGFNVRRNHIGKNTNGFLTRATFCCSQEGFRKLDKRSVNASYQKPTTRVGCKAQMTCKLEKNGMFKVVQFEPHHNHELVRTPMKHLLKVNRSLSDAQKSRVEDTENAGISIKSTIALLSREMGGREHIGFTDKDYRNYVHRKRKQPMEKGDALAISEYFQRMQSMDSSYFYSMQLDEEGMITNIFWADPHSISDYGLFGDVVCFDTTYRTNEYGRPFAPFVGVNHHKQTVIFGAALLYDETIDSFKWLFKTFLNAMGGKQPQTILTDQSAAMANAILQVFSLTCHRLCVWHIYQNAAKNLSHVFNGSKKFVEDFSKCMYDFEDEEEWLLAWAKMLDDYDLKENAWLKSMFEIKEKWALVYGRHTFTADMKSTQRSESLNSLLKQYLKPSHNLLRFFEHYERVLVDRRYEELTADFKMTHTKPIMLISTGMLLHGLEIYTPEVFNLFQIEYMKVLNYDIFKVRKEGTTWIYKVCFAGTSKTHYVTFKGDSQTTSCSCSMFTYLGILCAHALKVLDKKNVKCIPPQYIKKRWSRDAKARSITKYSDFMSNDSPKDSMGKRYSHLCRNFREIASCAAEDDNLTKYTHDCLVQLLYNLEKMKKTSIFSNGETSICANERVNQVDTHSDIVATMTPTGIKKKATVGRPRGRFKDPLERKRSKPKEKAKNVTKKNPTQATNNVPGKEVCEGAAKFNNNVTQEYLHSDAFLDGQNHVPFTQLLLQGSIEASDE